MATRLDSIFSSLSIPPASTRHFSSLARRLGRIFAHAYYHHREAFEQAEAESSLYARFLALTSKFALVPSEFLVIPPRMSIQANPQTEEEDGDGDDSSPEEEGPSDVPDISREDYMNTARRISGQERQWLLQPSGILTGKNRGVSPPGSAGDARNASPRKGRSRTDTMVHSEAVNVAEELAKGQGFSEAELDRAIAQERVLSTEEPLAAETEEQTGVAEASTEEPHEPATEQPEVEEALAADVAEPSQPAAEEQQPEPSEAPAETPAEGEKAPVEEFEDHKEIPAAEGTQEEVDVTEDGEPADESMEAEQPNEPAAHKESEADIAGSAAEEPASEAQEEDEHEGVEEHAPSAEVAASELDPHEGAQTETAHPEPAAQEGESKEEL